MFLTALNHNNFRFWLDGGVSSVLFLSAVRKRRPLRRRGNLNNQINFLK